MFRALKSYRDCLPYIYRLPIHLSRNKIRQTPDHALSLFVEIRVFATHNLNLTYLTGLGNNELNENSALNVVFLSCGWITDVIGDILH